MENKKTRTPSRKKNLLKKKRSRSKKHTRDQESAQENDAFFVEISFLERVLFFLDECMFSCFLTFFFLLKIPSPVFRNRGMQRGEMRGGFLAYF